MIGISLPSWIQDHGDLALDQWAVVALLFLVVYCNLLAFSIFDHEVDKATKRNSLVTVIGVPQSKTVVMLIIYATIFLTVFAVVLLASTLAFLVLFFMCAVLLWIIKSDTYFSANDNYRLLGDAIFFYAAGINPIWRMRRNGFDILAPHYDWMAALVYGSSIRKAQLCFAGHIPDGASVLILGGGTGWYLRALMKRRPTCKVHYVEASKKMIDWPGKIQALAWPSCMAPKEQFRAGQNLMWWSHTFFSTCFPMKAAGIWSPM
ncbi:MAG: hypothetical protein HC859_03975 [Bacteroidia bacterium]|nr:hypothetical protein [Bacteroidia bacterium]